MTRVLAIADEIDESLGPNSIASIRPDLVVSCGDLPRDWLEYVVTLAGVPLLYVAGNHDPDYLAPRRPPAVEDPRFLGFPDEEGEEDGERVRPAGCVNVDGRIAHAAGLVVAGLGGCLRYREGPNQYTQAQMAWRGRWLEVRARLRHPLRRVDVLLTHAPPFGLGDEEDLPHRGFEAFHGLVRRLAPVVLIHGHIHPYGRERPDRWIGRTRVVNAVGHRVLDVTPRTGARERQAA